MNIFDLTIRQKTDLHYTDRFLCNGVTYILEKSPDCEEWSDAYYKWEKGDIVQFHTRQKFDNVLTNITKYNQFGSIKYYTIASNTMESNDIVLRGEAK